MIRRPVTKYMTFLREQRQAAELSFLIYKNTILGPNRPRKRAAKKESITK